jgi:hypothetical protein
MDFSIDLRDEDGSSLHQWGSSVVGHPIARASSCFDRAFRAWRPVGSRQDFRGFRNCLLSDQPRLRLAHGGLLLVALEL